MSDISRAIPISSAVIKAAEDAQLIVEQKESDSEVSQYFDLSTFSPLLQAQRFRNLKDIHSHLTHKMEESEDVEEQRVFEVEKVDEAAARYQRNNDELSASTLRILKSRILASDTPEDALNKVLSVYADASLADEALDFLIETSDPETQKVVRAAKELLNSTRSREIIAGKNMGAFAREFSKDGLGSPTSLRDLYRDVTGTAREPIKLFDELSEKFPYSKLKTAITFLLHSLGSDLKAKGSSIPRPELKRLIDDTRSLQGILGVFRFFQSRMSLIGRLFANASMMLPDRVNFEILAKILVKILGERFMNPDKILQTAKLLGISEEALAQLIVYQQMLDALKQIAPRYYRNLQHREELRKAFLDTLDKLEDQVEEEEEKEKEEEDDR